MTASVLAAIDAIVDRSGDPDDVLRAVVAALVEEGGCAWAGILFAEGDELALGPTAGDERPAPHTRTPVIYGHDRVAEIVTDGCDDAAFLDRVALLIAPYCLVGWDTGGVPWDPAA
jgi:hypothetical protein